MSRLYTTKSLGREWFPSPLQRNYNDVKINIRDSYNEFSYEKVNGWKGTLQDHIPSAIPPSLWPNFSSSKRYWSRVHERILLVLCCLGVLAYLFSGRSRGMLSASTEAETAEMLKEDLEIQLRAHNATWSNFAYLSYATSLDGLCNAAMIMEALSRLGSKADRLVIYPEHWDLLPTSSPQRQLLSQAQFQYGSESKSVSIRPKTKSLEKSVASMKWKEDREAAILWGFNATEYRRVLVLDAGVTLLGKLDELFLLPEGMPTDEEGKTRATWDVAAPLAYWKDSGKGGPYARRELNEGVVVIKPSETGELKVREEIKKKPTSTTGVLSRVFGKQAMALSYRPFTLLGQEFRKQQHGAYLGADGTWDPIRALAEAKVVSFGEEEVKPWEKYDARKKEDMRPQCKTMVNGAEVRQDCGDRDVWDWLYADFAERRLNVCGLGMQD